MADAKTIALVEKLLRLASPRSNASENERQIAALEAAKIIAENALTIGNAPPPAPPPRRRENEASDFYRRYSPPTRPPPTPRYSAPDWKEGTIDMADWCVICHHPLEVGERAFYYIGVGWRCYDIDCGNAPDPRDT